MAFVRLSLLCVVLLVCLFEWPGRVVSVTLYVSSSIGSDSNGCGSVETPCRSVWGAVSNSTGPVTLIVEPGDYSGNLNINIQLPHDTTLQNNDTNSGEVTFACSASTSSTGFATTNCLHLVGITISNCLRGINFEPAKASQNLIVENSRILSCNTGILLQGGSLSIKNSLISECIISNESLSSGSAIYNPTSEIQITNSISIEKTSISNTEAYSIFSNNKIETMSIASSNFNSYGAIYIAGDQNSFGNVSDCSFVSYQGIENINPIDISKGSWNIKNITMEGTVGSCSVAFRTETKNSNFENISISICDFAVYAMKGKTKITDGSFVGPRYGVGVDFQGSTSPAESSLDIHRVQIQNSDTIIALYCDKDDDNLYQVTIKDCTFEETGTISIGCACDGVISNTIFSNILNVRAIDFISGGEWEFENVTVQNMKVPGGFNFLHSGVSASFNNCLFDNNFGDDGSAIYFGGKNLNISDSLFLDNVADNNGAGIYLDSGACYIGSGVSFVNNSAWNGAAIYCTSDLGVTFVAGDTVFDGNINEHGSNDVSCSRSQFWPWVFAVLLAIPFVAVLLCVLLFMQFQKVENELEIVEVEMVEPLSDDSVGTTEIQLEICDTEDVQETDLMVKRRSATAAF